MSTHQVVVVGAGMGGLAAALRLAQQGLQVTVIDAAAAPGGKLQQPLVGGVPIDSGPTVFTMRWVFDEILGSVGQSLDDHVRLVPVDTLARHAWGADGKAARLDLYADPAASEAAIGDFAGAAEATTPVASGV